jgi:hypothetical protein
MDTQKFIDKEKHTQQDIIDKQDVLLGEAYKKLTNIQHVAIEMSNSLGEQNKDLELLSGDTAKSQRLIDRAISRVTRFMSGNDGCISVPMLILVLLLIVFAFCLVILGVVLLI